MRDAAGHAHGPSGGAAEDLVVQLAEPGFGLGSELVSQDAAGPW